MSKLTRSSKSSSTRWGAIVGIVMVSVGCLCFIVSATMAIGAFAAGANTQQ